MRLVGVRIGSEDPAAAIAAYGLLLDVPGTPCAGGGVRFRLGRGSVDVVAGGPGLRTVRFVSDAGDPPLPTAHGIEVAVEPEDEAPPPPEPHPPSTTWSCTRRILRAPSCCGAIVQASGWRST